MSILIALIPALAWGFLPIVVSKIGGKPSNQIMGTTTGTFLVALVSFLVLRPDTSPQVFILSALSGALWVLGQTGQYYAYVKIGVSKTMPISTGLQLVGTSLIGVLVFQEWPGTMSKLVGFIALGVIVIGIFLISMHRGGQGQGGMDKSALVILFFTNFGYLAYSAIPDVVGKGGTAIFFPQALGMLCAATLYIIFSKQTEVFKSPTTWKNILSGFIFSIAALSYIVAAQRVGIATAFVLSQLSVIISTIAGIVILHERKSPFELKATIAGLVLIVAAGVTIAFL